MGNMSISASIDPSTDLLIAETSIMPGERVVILNGTDPALEAVASKGAAELVIFPVTASAADGFRARATSKSTVSLDVFPTEQAAFDVALLPIPKGREAARGMLWAARLALRPGGRLYVAGLNDGGIKTVMADASVLFGTPRTLTTRRRCRVAVAINKTSSASAPDVYPAEWGDNPTQMQTRQFGEVIICTVPGLFSWDTLDEGTALLLDNLSIAPGERVLDIGCGYGVIGLTAAARGADYVVLSDDSLLAAHCAYAGMQQNGFANVEVTAGNLFGGLPDTMRGTFDHIVSNPPFHHGFETDTQVMRRLCSEAGDWLHKSGKLTVVGNTFLRYDRLLRESFGRVRTIVENTRYAVWEAGN